MFPFATLVQLWRILRDRSAVGVSVTTWLLFGFANLGMYVYAERYTEWQAILGTLFTAVVDFAIVVLVLCGYGSSKALGRSVGRALGPTCSEKREFFVPAKLQSETLTRFATSFGRKTRPTNT